MIHCEKDDTRRSLCGRENVKTLIAMTFRSAYLLTPVRVHPDTLERDTTEFCKRCADILGADKERA